MRKERCCLCPNVYSRKKLRSGVCPGIPETLHPEPGACAFVNVWRDENGIAVFVDHEIGGGNFMSFRRGKSGGLHRVKTKSLPLQKTFDEAQADLNLYAEKKGWPPSETQPELIGEKS